MEIKPTIKISVRELVEFALKSGDISSSFVGSTRMVEGTKTHQAVQKSYEVDYTPEVPISYGFERNGFSVQVSGRIDGVINTDNGIVIDEIKTTMTDPDYIDESCNPCHFAQARCYGYIYCKLNDVDHIFVQVTYCQLDTRKIKSIRRQYDIDELEEIFFNLADKYLKRVKMIHDWSGIRDESTKNLDFPYSDYRKGQRKFAVEAYKAIKAGQTLYAQAPTGTGKTIAAIFPSLKALGEGHTSKVFYLTSKTTIASAAEYALKLMRKTGLKLKSATLTAKEKICFTPGCDCNPDFCRYAKGYYDRVDEAIEDIFTMDNINRDVIESFSMKHNVCPFEFSLDVSMLCDFIICDYNYLFDPRVYLKRFFIDGGDYTFLIDEAHNLVDRAREMYSAELVKRDVLNLKRDLKKEIPEVSKNLNGINKLFIKLRKECEESGNGHIVQSSIPAGIVDSLREFIKVSEKYLSSGRNVPFKEELLDMYFKASAFIRVSEYYDERFTAYWENAGGETKLKLFCIDPSLLIHESLKRGRSAIFFSATLSPMDYFVECLGGDRNCRKLILPSPFPHENLLLLINNSISTKYVLRETTYDKVSQICSSLVTSKAGNYLIYFPSYKYMMEVYERFTESNPGVKTLCQKPNMTEGDRGEFLNSIKENSGQSLAGFAVMGGVFGEGIDLAGDLLIGAVIVGVGLPQVCLERDIIRKYYHEKIGYGYEYSYIFPGMNRVMQAAGRVIRTENDRGVVLLIDDRFSQTVYRRLFPGEWDPVYIRDQESMNIKLNNFWSK
jgi:Rad3-related DNA helicases